jgi:hypothetical protein
MWDNAKYKVQFAFNFLRINDPYTIAPNLIILKLQRDIIVQKKPFQGFKKYD